MHKRSTSARLCFALTLAGAFAAAMAFPTTMAFAAQYQLIKSFCEASNCLDGKNRRPVLSATPPVISTEPPSLAAQTVTASYLS
jgi:hypothetical protein